MIKINFKQFALDRGGYFGFWYQSYSDGNGRWHWEWDWMKHNRRNKRIRKMIQQLKDIGAL